MPSERRETASGLETPDLDRTITRACDNPGRIELETVDTEAIVQNKHAYILNLIKHVPVSVSTDAHDLWLPGFGYLLLLSNSVVTEAGTQRSSGRI